ncbi:MAG TPA: hypothetical protein VLV16_09305 [Gemmatimonadales bacterium]|nr:hypothetical protein [Gemmatimonadales bacterium]
MFAHRRSVGTRLVAIALIAALAAWQPAMALNMARMTHAGDAMAHHGHHQGAPTHHHAQLDCCSACVLACAAAGGMPTAGQSAVQPPQIHRAEAPTAPALPALSSPQHRLPPAVGPPSPFSA